MKFLKKKLAVWMLLLSMVCAGLAGSPDSYAAAADAEVSASEEAYDYSLTAEDILIRDPYIVTYEGKYYLYGTDGTNAFGGQMDSFLVYVSEDLENWAGPYTIFKNDGTFWADAQYWAPEIYYMDGEFYLYGSMGGSSRTNKGIQLFKSKDPLGPFEPTTEYPFTPEEDDDIDATLFEEDGDTYMVYSQGAEGIFAVKLTDTKDGFAQEQFLLFNVSESDWPIAAFGGMVLNDGPCFYRTASGKLICLFSSMSEEGYNMGIAYSDNGRLDGKWTVTNDRLDVGGDGGHCMIFTDLNGQTRICYHAPNGASHPVIRYLVEDPQKDTVFVSDKLLVENVFEDVKADDWFVDAAQYVYDNGIMTGMDATHFGPERDLSRAQLAVMIWRMEGSSEMEYTEKFPDVADGIWYADAVLWASQNNVGIITGYTDGSRKGQFGPADAITREQLATMLYRYSEYKNYDTTAQKALSEFPDGAKVSPYAEKAMIWVTGAGIITGNEKDQMLAPQAEASRAQAATMIQRFLENTAK